jgi:hypothetical protein
MTPVIEEARGSGAIGPTRILKPPTPLCLRRLGRRLSQQATAALRVGQVQPLRVEPELRFFTLLTWLAAPRWATIETRSQVRPASDAPVSRASASSSLEEPCSDCTVEYA